MHTDNVEKNLYLVIEGDAEVVTCDNRHMKMISDLCDYQKSVLCIAKDQEEAFELANLFDAGEIQEDNHFYPDCYGPCIVALSQQCNRRGL